MKDLQSQIQKILSQTSQNMIVPRHSHNGVDAEKIDSFNINTSNPQGFIFAFSDAQNVVLQQDFANGKIGFAYTEKPPQVEFDIGNFKQINLVASGTNTGIDGVYLIFQQNNVLSSAVIASESQIVLTATDTVDQTSSLVLPKRQMYITTTGDFAIKLPPSNPSGPLAGDFWFDGNEFYVCKVNGIASQIVTL